MSAREREGGNGQRNENATSERATEREQSARQRVKESTNVLFPFSPFLISHSLFFSWCLTLSHFLLERKKLTRGACSRVRHGSAVALFSSRERQKDTKAKASRGLLLFSVLACFHFADHPFASSPIKTESPGSKPTEIDLVDASVTFSERTK